MRLGIIMVFVVMMGIVGTVRADPGNLTLTVLDELNQQPATFVSSITNGTHTFYGGRYGKFTTFSDPAELWMDANLENIYDFDPGSQATIECSNAAGCQVNTFELIADIAVPKYTIASLAQIFNVSVRCRFDGNDQLDVFIFNFNTQLYEAVGTASCDDVAEGTTSVFVRTNSLGRYGTNGVGRVKLENDDTAVQGNVYIIYDVWTASGFSSGHGVGNGLVPQLRTFISRNTLDVGGERIGGIPDGDLTVTLSADLYGTSTNYPQRKFKVTTGDSINASLMAYLLREDQGTNVQFIVKNQALGVIEGATLTAQANINGSFLTVHEDVTDDSGQVSAFLDTDKSSRLTFTAPGFGTSIITITPSAVSSPYTVVLKDESVLQLQTLFADIFYRFDPVQSTIDGSPGNRTINLTMVAQNSNLAEWGFNLTHQYIGNGTQTLIDNWTSTQASGGLLQGDIFFNTNSTNASNFDLILVDGFIRRIEDSTPTFFDTQYTVIIETPNNTSLFTILDELRTTGGLSEFALSMIALLISLVVAGFARASGLFTYGTGFVILGVLAFFVFVGFFSVVLWSLMLLLVVALYAVVQRGGL